MTPPVSRPDAVLNGPRATHGLRERLDAVRVRALPSPATEPSGGGAGLRAAIREREALEDQIFFIRRWGVVQRERLQAIADGAVLAAEQVQDKRIEFLERGPEVETSSLIIDFLIDLALDSTIAGHALAAATRTVMGPFFSTNRCLRRMAEQSLAAEGSDVKQLARAIRGLEGERAAGAIAELVKPAEMAAMRESMSSLATLDASGQKNAVAVGKAFKRAMKSATHSPPGRAGGHVATDSPGTAVLTAAQSYVSGERHALSLLEAALEGALRAGSVDVGQVRKFLEWQPLGLGDEPATIGGLRTQYKLFFEAAIWVHLYGFDLPEPHQPSMRRAFSRLVYVVDGRDLPDRYLDYWLNRFWVPNADPPTTFALQKGPIDPASSLRQYFLAIGRKWSAARQEGLDPLPLITPPKVRRQEP